VTPQGVIFLNPKSGPGDTTVEELNELFPGVAIQECAPDDLVTSVDGAMANGAEFIGVAGGDGTIRSVAARLVDGDVALLVIPAGTRNHFAKDLGIATLDEAVAAWREGTRQRVDVGLVNEQCFVNNSSVGAYPMMVIRRQDHEGRFPKAVANALAAWDELRHGRRVSITVDGRAMSAWMLFVGNGRYGRSVFDLADRDALGEGLLDVRIVRADQPLARLRVALSVAVGRLDHSRLIFGSPAPAVTIGSDRDQIEVALDGEVETLKTPLRYEVKRAALSVLVPPAS
jgi:diacylglycerol kinase family enzyme